jgi:tetratricopeptide (TPR) repeat protein
LAWLALLQGKSAEGHALLEEAIAGDPAAAAPRALKARVLLGEGQTQAALDLAAQVIRDHPNDVEARYVLGMAAARRQDWEQAAAAFYDVLAKNPRALSAYLPLGKVELARMRPTGAVDAATIFLKTFPNDREARLLLVRGLMVRGDLVLAERQLPPLLAERPVAAETEILAATLRLARKDRVGAKQGFERALAAEPGSLEAIATLARFAVEDGRPKQAVAIIERALVKDARNASLLIVAAKTFVGVRDLARAERALRDAIAIDPGSIEAFGLLAGVLLVQNRLDETKREFTELVKQQPRSAVAYTFLGMVHEAQQNWTEAEPAYRRALELDKFAVVAANNLAWRYAETNQRLDEALDLARTARSRFPNDPHVNDTLGWVAYKKELYVLAVEAFTMSINVNRVSPGTHYRLGLAYSKKPDLEKARQHLREALRLKPDFEHAADARRVLAEIGG